MQDILKKEWCTLFWKRVGVMILISILLNIFMKANSNGYKLINNISSYIVTTFLMMRMINNSHSRLILKDGDKKTTVDFPEMAKMYWSFFWREAMFGFILGAIFGVLILISVSFGLSQSGLIPIVVILILGIIIVSYFIGRHVFLDVIRTVNWDNKTLEVGGIINEHEISKE